MGVITYFLLCGYTPFDRDTQQQEMEAIIAGDYKFEPEEYWENVSETAKDFVRECLTIDPASRPTAEQALQHKWLASSEPHFVTDASGNMTNLLPHIQKAFDARKAWRKAVFSIQAMRRMSTLAALSPGGKSLGDNVRQFKEESEKVRVSHCNATPISSSTEGKHRRRPRCLPLPQRWRRRLYASRIAEPSTRCNGAHVSQQMICLYAHVFLRPLTISSPSFLRKLFASVFFNSHHAACAHPD